MDDHELNARRIRAALGVLLEDIRPLSSDEPYNRRIPVQHSVGAIREARAAYWDWHMYVSAKDEEV